MLFKTPLNSNWGSRQDLRDPFLCLCREKLIGTSQVDDLGVWYASWEQIAVVETPGLHCKSPDSGELRYWSKELKKAIRSDSGTRTRTVPATAAGGQPGGAGGAGAGEGGAIRSVHATSPAGSVPPPFIRGHIQSWSPINFHTSKSFQ